MKTIKDSLLIPMPPGIATLPKDKRGLPVPFIVHNPNDMALSDFRILNPDQRIRCATERLCGLCGQPLPAPHGRQVVPGELIWFIGGPRSTKNLTYIDPPMHLDCAHYALEVCPYLAIHETGRTAESSKVPHRVFTGAVPDKPERFYLLGTNDFKAIKFVDDPTNDWYFRARDPIIIEEWHDGAFIRSTRNDL